MFYISCTRIKITNRASTSSEIRTFAPNSYFLWKCSEFGLFREKSPNLDFLGTNLALLGGKAPKIFLSFDCLGNKLKKIQIGTFG